MILGFMVHITGRTRGQYIIERDRFYELDGSLENDAHVGNGKE